MSNLYQLIQSLNKSEKRYFKLYAQAFVKEPSTYLQLFDAIDKAEALDEKALIEEFDIKHFSVTKKYLFDNIVKSLRSYQAEQKPIFQILDGLKNISVLKNKGLLADAIKAYEKTEKQLKEYHLYTFLIELLTTGEFLWSAYLPNKEVSAKQEEIHQQKLLYIEYLDAITRYRALARSIKNTIRKSRPIRNEAQAEDMQAFLAHTLLQKKPSSQNIIARALYYECQTMCLMTLLEYNKVKVLLKEAIDLLQEQKEKSIVYHKTLIANLNNALLVNAKLQDDKAFWEYAEQYGLLQQELNGKINHGFDVVMQKLHYNFMMHHWAEKNDFSAITEMAKEVKQFWEQEETLLDTDWKMTVAFFMTQAFFYLKEFDKALEWNMLLLEEEKNNPKLPCICNARVFNLMIHTETKNFILLNSLFRSTYRFFKKNKRLFESERALLNFFKWLGNNDMHPKLNERFLKLLDNLEKCAQNKYEQNFLEEMKLSIWINEKKKLYA